MQGWLNFSEKTSQKFCCFITYYTLGYFFHSPCTRTFTQNSILVINLWIDSLVILSLYLHILGANDHARTAIWAPWTASGRLLGIQVCRSKVIQGIPEQNFAIIWFTMPSMVSWTNFHDHRTQNLEINLNVQIYINITGVPKLWRVVYINLLPLQSTKVITLNLCACVH